MRGWRSGPTPAIWRGNLKLLHQAKAKLHKVKHFTALDWREAPAFIAKLRERDSVGASALQFAILTTARSGEVRGATWDEIDMEAAEWNIPGRRMKAGKPHRVPLSQPALEVLRSMELLRTGTGPVFPGQKLRKPLTDLSLTRPLERAGRGELTAHGFRSTFRDWAVEATAC